MAISISNYGSSFDSSPDVVLICPHGNEGESFIRSKGLLGLVDDPSHFNLYNAIETDRGSSELSHEIARQITARANGVMVEVVELTLPRSVVDCNRKPDTAVRKIVDWRDFRYLEEELLDLHMIAVSRVIDSLLQMTYRGVYLDVHTMADFCPVGASFDPEAPALHESPTTLSSYAESFMNRSGSRRVTDLICSKGAKLLADERLLFSLESSFAQYDVPSTRNAPYSLNDRVMSTFYAENFRGLTVDVVKGELLVDPSNMATSLVDFSAVTRVATPFSDAIIDRLNASF